MSHKKVIKMIYIYIYIQNIILKFKFWCGLKRIETCKPKTKPIEEATN